MQLQVKAAALITVTFISGCGFVPKKPPALDHGQRLPINLTAPNPHPWSRTVVNSQVAPRVVTASTTSEQTKPSKPDPISIDTKAGAITEREPIAIWPVLLTYNPDETISSALSSSPLTKVSFSWPEPQAPIVTNDVKASQPLTSDTFVEATVNRTGNRGGCLVKVKQIPQREPRAVDNNALRLRPVAHRQSIQATVDG